VKLAGTLTCHSDFITTAVVFERDMERLVNVSKPVPKKLERSKFLIVIGIVGLQNCEISLECVDYAFSITGTGISSQPLRITRQIMQEASRTLRVSTSPSTFSTPVPPLPIPGPSYV
jgi:hypothetical protein